MNWIDSHAHLNDPAFDADRTEVLARMQTAGVERFVEIGCQTNEWEKALTLCQAYPNRARAALGIHPEFAHTWTSAEWERFKKLLTNPQVVAVGEIGLDYFYLDECPKNTQLHTLQQMLQLATEFQKPVVLHVRRQAEDYEPYKHTFAYLKQYWTAPAGSKWAGVLHCFSARYEEAKQALDQGLLLGINGCFTYKKNEYIREAVKKVGADKLVLETDCPYLAPQGKRGTRNDPSNIPLIGTWVADYLNMPLEKLAEITTQNALDLYHWQ